MSYITADRVKETTIIVGTGTVSLLGTSTGFRTFASQMTVGDTCSYIISNASGSEWESGIATYSSANTLTRTSVKSSSNSNNRVVFTGGVKDVFIGVTADSVVDKNNARLNTINAIPVASGVGNDLTLIAGSGVGVGAGGNIVLTPGSQGSSGGDGKVLIDGLTVGKGGSSSNTVLGELAFNSDDGSLNNTALGYYTLKNNSIGSANVAVGTYALTTNNSGYYLTAVGYDSLSSNNSGANNTGFGAESLRLLSNGSNNTAIGSQAGANLINGSNNIFMGANVSSISATGSNFMTIGNLIYASGGFGTSTTVGVGNVGIGQNAPTAKLHVTGTSASTKVAIVQGASSQTENLQEWQNSSGTALSYINASGTLFDNAINAVPVVSGVGNSLTLTAGSGVTSGAGGSLILQAGVQATTGGDGKVVVKQVAGQTSNLQEWQDSTGSALGSFSINGQLILGRAISAGVSTGIRGSGSQDGVINFAGGSLQIGRVDVGYEICNIGAYSTAGLTMTSAGFIGWSNGSSTSGGNSSPYLALYKDANDILAQRRTTNAQAFRVYNTYTDASNYERAEMGWSGNVFYIGIGNAGTGTARRLSLSSGTGTSIAVSSTMEYQSGSLVFKWYNGSTIGVGPSFSDIYFSNPNNLVSVRNGTTGQSFAVYNTFTDTSNYERLGITWASNICTISPENAGTGSPRALTLATPSLGTTGTVPALSLVAGNGTVTGAKGGSINITAGNGGSGNGGGGGSVTIAAGVNVADNTQPPGNITITAGQSGGAAQSGSVTIQGGTSSVGGAPAGGTVNILGGAQGTPGNVATTSSTGSVVVKSPDSNALMGSAATSLANPTGNVSIATGNGGTISVASTQPTITTGSSGTISISTGAGGSATVIGTTRNAGSSGTITISTNAGGNASGGTTNNGGSSGSIIIGTGVAGTGSTANGTVGTIQFNVGGINTANVLSTGLGSNAVTAIPLPTTTATVTAATGNATTVTYTAANTFSVGQIVSITGLTITTGSSLNLANQTITTASSTQFTVTNATVGTAAATQSGTATIQSAGNSVTITAGNGSGVGAGGNIILQPGAQGSSGGNGLVRFYSSAGVYTGYWDPNTSTLNGGDTLYITSKLRVRSGAYINGSYGLFDFAVSNNASTVVVTLHDSNGFRMNRTGIYGFSNDVYGTNWTSAATDAGIGRADFGVTCVVRDTSKNGGSLSFPSTTTAFSANTNDLALTASAFQRINCTSAASLTGIAPPSGGTHVDGRMVRVYNVGTTNLTLAHNSASSTAANRMFSSTGADIILAPNDYAELIYDANSNGSGAAGWRVS